MRKTSAKEDSHGQGRVPMEGPTLRTDTAGDTTHHWLLGLGPKEAFASLLIHHEMFDNHYSWSHSLGCRLGEEHQGPSGGDSGEQNSLFQGPTSRTYSGSSLRASGPQSHICDLRTVTQAPVSLPAVGGSGKLMWKKVFYKQSIENRQG